MIGITMGDANGVGPEIVLRAFSENRIPVPFMVIGDLAVLQQSASELCPDVEVHKMADYKDHRAGYMNILDSALLSVDDLTVGKISKKAGKASLAYVTTAARLALDGKIDGMVTLPVNKEAIRLSVPGFSGHTDHIASICGTQKITMMLVSERLVVTHISTHTSLLKAIGRIKTNRILEVIRLTAEALKKLGYAGRIAVAGLNPHAGEHGAFGMEDIHEIEPAVRQACETGMNIDGPVPPDTVFYQAVNGKYDAVVCMYHDQGHIPLKLLAFDSAVNVTLGLPIIRTSVDHGTAYDIAWKGSASLSSFCNAIDLALRLQENI